MAENQPPLYRNRYILTGLIFLVWMGVIDRDDWISQRNLDRKIHEIEKQRLFYSEEIIKVKSGLEDIQKQPAKLEKFAREKYYMKRDNEDLYVLLPQQKSISRTDSFFNTIRSIFSKPTPQPVK